MSIEAFYTFSFIYFNRWFNLRKFFEVIGLLSLACFSFFITEKTTTVFENVDNIMLQIKNNSYKYNIDSIDASINNNTIIPGIYGRYVDIKKKLSQGKGKYYFALPKTVIPSRWPRQFYI